MKFRRLSLEIFLKNLKSKFQPPSVISGGGDWESRFHFKPISSLPSPDRFIKPNEAEFPSKHQTHQPPNRHAPPPPGKDCKNCRSREIKKSITDILNSSRKFLIALSVSAPKRPPLPVINGSIGFPGSYLSNLLKAFMTVN